MISSACRSVMSGEMVTGQRSSAFRALHPVDFLACRSMGMLRCTIPMPPCRAMAMAGAIP